MSVIILIGTLIALCLLMAVAWRVSHRTGKSGFTDVFWTYGTGVAGVALALAPMGDGVGVSARQMLVAVLVAAWSLRLGAHILMRTLKGGDDPRYAKLRQDWGAAASRRMFWFLQIQALTIAGLVVAVAVTARNPRPGLDARDWIGLVIAATGIMGEAVSDHQLKTFAAQPGNKGQVCDRGLWSWSRHPNYFFEFLGWLAYPVMAIDVVGYPWGWLALIGPLMIYWLLVYASGIPPLEDYMVRSRGEAFRSYQARTSAFFPWPPKPDRSGGR